MKEWTRCNKQKQVHPGGLRRRMPRRGGKNNVKSERWGSCVSKAFKNSAFKRLNRCLGREGGRVIQPDHIDRTIFFAPPWSQMQPPLTVTTGLFLPSFSAPSICIAVANLLAWRGTSVVGVTQRAAIFVHRPRVSDVIRDFLSLSLSLSLVALEIQVALISSEWGEVWQQWGGICRRNDGHTTKPWGKKAVY